MAAKSCMVLIGMPGVGKTTVGKQLANALAYHFVDTDRLIEAAQNSDLQTLLNTQGYRALRAIEQQCILSTQFNNAVVATGGSAVYGELAMRHLQRSGDIIYLAASINTLHQRITNWQSRGIACPTDQTPESLYAERVPLYQRYADHCFETNGLSTEQVVADILACYR